MNMYSERFRAVCGVAGLMTALFIVYASLKPPSGEAGLAHLDKAQHFLAYGVLSALTASALGVRNALVPLALIGFGGALEILQGAMPYDREPELADGLANAAGVLAGTGLVALLRRLLARRER